MGNVYTKPSISGFNANPPSDDGSQVSSNEVKWATHINKIGGPLKDYIDSINNNVESAFADIAFNAVTAKSSAYTVQTSDRGALLSVTNATTITLLAAATAGSGFFIGIYNNGSDTVTVDGDSSETINGETTIDLAPGDSLLLTTSGTSWTGPLVRKPTFQEFTASGTWNRPNGVKHVLVEVIGAGGGGGGGKGSAGDESGPGGGGGGGGYAAKFIDVSGISSSTITVGSGGSGGTGNNSGSSGGNSSWSDGTNTVTANGGNGGGAPGTGSANFNASGGGAGGSATGGDVNASGNGGTGGAATGDNVSKSGMSGAGGGSYYGGGANSVNASADNTANGNNGGNYGGGGSGGLVVSQNANATGGDGADGLVRVWEF